MKKELFVPFKKNGDMLDYSYYGLSQEEEQKCKEEGRFEKIHGNYIEVFVPNFEFEDTLVFTHFSRGRSSVKAHFRSKYTEVRYEMFISDFEDVLKHNRIGNSHIRGKFTFVKKGANYGVKLCDMEGV